MVILYSRWCALPISTRMKIAEVFGIIKKGATQVDSNVIKHDGYLIEDIDQMITLEAMQKFLQCQNDDIGFVFNLMIDKIEGKELIGLVPMDVSVSATPAMSVLPAEEVKQFKKEYNIRKKLKKQNDSTKN